MDLLKKLVDLSGVSSNEGDVRDFIIKECKKYTKNVGTDKMGNVIAVFKGTKPSVMLMAHMDEIGLMVSSINKQGRISVSPIGGIDPYILLGQKVNIETRNAKKKSSISGIVTIQEVLDGGDVKKDLIMDDLFVYTGLGKKELLAIGIDVGSYVTFSESSKFSYLGSLDLIGGKALDDRIGCYILLELMKEIKCKHEVIFVFTVQEEVGLHGARASIFNLQPDYAVAVDVTPHNSFDESIMLRNGPVLTVKDAEMIANKSLVDDLRKAAKKVNVELQLEVSEAGTTDATSIFASKGGVPSAVFGVAVGNIHTPVSVAYKKDIQQAISVLKTFLKTAPTKL